MKTLIAFLLPVALAMAANLKLGKQFSVKEAIPVDVIASQPEQYVGKTVQVKGQVSEVCKKAGCWMQLVDPSTNKAMRIKVKDGDIVFPETAVGKMAVAEGTLKKIEMTKEQVLAARKHQAEEQGRTFDPSTVTGGETMYQIAGTGAVILE